MEPVVKAGLEACSSSSTGYLDFSTAKHTGTGHHSRVYSVQLSLAKGVQIRASDGDDSDPSTVRVAAKMAIDKSSARTLLTNEAKMYHRFPSSLSESWMGYNLVPPMLEPVPASAVIPQFYGYYVPAWRGCTEIDDKAKESPILLMEDCGSPVSKRDLSEDETKEIFSMFLRLHLAEFIHLSAYQRNIVFQPGPLTIPPHLRSKGTPSFRVIDFGR
ncbi:hypothetical protein CONPUDRAFT_112503, partial [Coniophora puteana RWD-64-598 SS2]